MALDPLELATIAGILIVFFLWGPQKIPEMARLVQRARKEVDTATKQFQNAAMGLQDGTSALFAPNPPPQASLPGPAPVVRSAFPQQPQTPAAPTAPTKTGDQLLIEAARKLGISTQGKTREQIQEEIIALAQRPTAGKSSPPAPKPEDSTG